MKDEGILKRELARVGNDLIGVINDRIARNAPGFVANGSAAVLAGWLGVIAVADVPDGVVLARHFYFLGLRFGIVSFGSPHLRRKFVIRIVELGATTGGTWGHVRL